MSRADQTAEKLLKDHQSHLPCTPLRQDLGIEPLPQTLSELAKRWLGYARPSP
jgi:hypothetical protein